MQVHYHSEVGALPTDRSKMKVWFADKPVTEHLRVVWTGTLDIDVPPGESSTATGVCDVPSGAAPVKLLSVSPHMHQTATSFRSTVERSNGSEACLVDIPSWDFDWQGGYMYKDPIMLYEGDRIRTSCTYKNTGTETVGFGEGTEEEMCFQFNFVVDDGSLPDMCFFPCNYIPCDDFL